MYIKTIICFSILVSIVTLQAQSADTNLQLIMQGLRDDAVEISDGLLIDDFNMVANGAARIANHAQIPPHQVQLVAAELGTEMAAFKHFDTSVHDLAESIAVAAENNDRERAIADYQQMLNNCLACHAAYKARVSAVLGNAE
jgi:hypothetical protein